MQSELASNIIATHPLVPPSASAGPTPAVAAGFADAVADAVDAQTTSGSAIEAPAPHTRPGLEVIDSGKQLPPVGTDLPLAASAEVLSAWSLAFPSFDSTPQGATLNLDDEESLGSGEGLTTDLAMPVSIDSLVWPVQTPAPLVMPEVATPLSGADEGVLAVQTQPSIPPSLVPLALATTADQAAIQPAPFGSAAHSGVTKLAEATRQLLRDDELSTGPITLGTTEATESGEEAQSATAADADVAPGFLLSLERLPQASEADEGSDFGRVVEPASSQSGPMPSSDPNLTAIAPAGPMLTGELGKSTPLTLILDAEIGSEPWLRELGQQVVWQASADIQHARIRLNPEDLGPIEVEVRVVDSATEVHFIATHPSTRDALEQGLGRLREHLDAAGLSLGAASVGDGHVDRDTNKGHEAQLGHPPLHWRDQQTEAEDLPLAVRVRHGLIDEYA